jgi:soluble cytochrome b562
MSESFAKPLDKRVDELESLVWEFPTLINMRFERFDTEFTSMRSAIDDNTRRLAQVERGFILIQADIRDFRNGMTRLMGAYGGRIDQLDHKVDQLDRRVERLEKDMGDVKTAIGTLDAKFGGLDAKVGTLNGKMDEVLTLLRARG